VAPDPNQKGLPALWPLKQEIAPAERRNIVGASMVASLRRGCAALGFVVFAALVAPGPAGAQRPQPVSAPNPDVGFKGIPEFTSTETGIPFFDQANAQLADQVIRDTRDAIAKCDERAYNRAGVSIANKFYTLLNAQHGTPEAELAVVKLRRDSDALDAVNKMRPPFPHPCTPPPIKVHEPYSAYLIGGALVPISGIGNVTGVDTFFGAGNFLIDNRANGGSSNALGMAGARARLSAALFEVAREWSKSSAPHFSIFAESGVQSSFGAQSFNQTFQGVSTTPQGFGSNTIKENFQIPVLIGAALPLTGPGQMPVFLDLYGGITLDNWTQTLQGREAGAPGGSGFFGQNNRFTVDPTVGGGIRMVVGDIASGTFRDVIIGANAEVQFRPGSVVTAASPNFPSQTYYGTTGPQTNLVFMFRIGLPFGGPR
jgi:hypothetical protein